FCLSFTFFCSGYGDHRDLRSFPTRRSSDLPPVRYYVMGAVGEEGAPGNEWRAVEDWKPATEPVSYFLQNGGSLTTTAAPDASTTDRKSTRLNSSHVKISYAVFCLKKKKRIQ